MRPSLSEYDAAEQRLKLSLEQRALGFPTHTYPRRKEDLNTMGDFHRRYGYLPAGYLARLWWRLRRGE